MKVAENYQIIDLTYVRYSRRGEEMPYAPYLDFFLVEEL